MNALILRSVCIHPPQHWHSSSSESYTKRPHKPAGDVLPAAQLLAHVEAPVAPEYLPASQLRHAAIDVAPACGEYVPGAQVEHVSESALE